MKRLIMFFAAMFATALNAQSVPTMVRPVTLSGAQGLNAAMQTKADVSGGSLSNPSISGGTLSGTAISGTAISGGSASGTDLSAAAQVAPGATVTRTLAARSLDIIRAQDFGVVCDGTTDDSAALQAALNAGSAKGGRTILLPATKHSCVLKTGVIVSDGSHSGNTLQGSSHGLYWPGPYDNTESDWTQFGTWIRCEDTTNPCLTMNGNGSAVRNINFWYTQPTPPANVGCGQFCTMTHNWSPTVYPFTIQVAGTQNFNGLSNINVVNGYDCIDFEGGSSGVNNIYTYAEHMHLGCVHTVAKFNRVDNIIDIHDWHDNLWWYPFSSDVIGYTEGDTTSAGHRIGWDASYLANLQGTGIEFYQDATAIKVSDQTVQSGLGTVTIGMNDVALSNVDFNQVCEAVGVEDGTTHVLRDSMSGVHLNVDPQTSNSTQCAGALPNAFNLATSNLSMVINGLQVGYAQTIAAIGYPGVTGGVLHVSGMSADNFSAYGSGGSAFLLQGGSLDAPAGINYLFSSNSDAGPRVAGDAGQVENEGVDVTGPVGSARQYRLVREGANGSDASTARWGIKESNDAESGNNSGSNFSIDRYNDTGVYQDSPIQINRSSGQVYFPMSIKISLPTSCTGLSSGSLYNNSGVVNVCS